MKRFGQKSRAITGLANILERVRIPASPPVSYPVLLIVFTPETPSTQCLQNPVRRGRRTSFAPSLQGANRGVNRCGTQVHVTLRGRQIHMAGELLNGSRPYPAHRQVRAERGTKGVTPWC